MKVLYGPKKKPVVLDVSEVLEWTQTPVYDAKGKKVLYVRHELKVRAKIDAEPDHQRRPA